MLFLCEIKFSVERYQQLVERCQFRRYFTVNTRENGGLALMWHEELHVKALFSLQNMIHMTMKHHIYEPPYLHKKANIWNQMEILE